MMIEITKIGRLPRVLAKVGSMRKPQDFLVQRVRNSEGLTDSYIVQSDKCIGRFNAKTGWGVLNIKGTTFMHLSPSLGARKLVFPADFIAACVDNVAITVTEI